MEKEKRTIDLKAVFLILWNRRKLFFKVVPIVFIVSCIYIFPQPRYYSAEVSLAPEASGAELGGGLASIASSFGFNLGGLAGNDAIYPTLYPELFESPEFLVSLLDIQVKTLDGEICCDYYTYLKDHQKKNPYTLPFSSLSEWLSTKKEEEPNKKLDAFHLSEKDYNLVLSMQDKIKCSNDKRTDVTTIRVEAQDPLVCALLADSISARLQNFIIRYRTSKARLDLEYYQQLSDSALIEYNVAGARYSAFCDANKNMSQQSVLTRKSQLQTEFDLKQTTYQAYQAQVQAMKSKVQEKTPAFTVLKSSIVPVRASGPKRVIFVLTMCFLATVGLAFWLCRKELHLTF